MTLASTPEELAECSECGHALLLHEDGRGCKEVLPCDTDGLRRWRMCPCAVVVEPDG